MEPLFVRGLKLRRELPEGSWLEQVPALRYLRQMEELPITAPVTFFIGENGAGKSTLIEAVAVAMGFNPEGGTVNFRFSTEDSHSQLHAYLTVVRGAARPRDGFFLRAESFYNVATDIDRMDREGYGPPLIDRYGGVSLHCQSHGESFLALVENRFGPQGLYILDEPEAALSPSRQLRLLCAIDRLVGEGAQLLICTHSPILMAYPGAQLYELSEAGIRPTDYRDTEHYRLTRQFLNDPERMLHYLLREQ